MFQSSFELTGYITDQYHLYRYPLYVSKLFRAYGLYNKVEKVIDAVSVIRGFKALSSLRVI